MCCRLIETLRPALSWLAWWAPCAAMAWGSLYPGETHQYILRQAYQLLASDPALSGVNFPTLEQMLAHEGVAWTVDGLKGVGPDAAGMSRYSDHYYNPITQEGNGPQAAAYYFGMLSRAVTLSKGEAAAKSGAWGAHFLADMFVPYHVVGTTRTRARDIFDAQMALHPGVVELPAAIFGSGKLAYLSPFKGGNTNFHTEIRRLLYKTNPDESDWFDPWYFNGNTETMMTKTSSHIAWEVTPQPTAFDLPRVVPIWTNATARLDNPQAMQSEQVRRLAIISATETRNHLEELFDRPAPGINRAIQAVHTVWRASFSGMRPKLEYSKESSDTYQVRGMIGNAGSAEVSALLGRLTPQGCRLLGPAEQPIPGQIAPGGSIKSPSWRVRLENEPCQLKLEVTGHYAGPDLQYAQVESHLMPPDQPKATGLKNSGYFAVHTLYALDDKVNTQQAMQYGNRFSGEKLHWKGNAFSFKATTHYKPSDSIYRDVKEISFEGTVASDGSRIDSFNYKCTTTEFNYDEQTEVRVEQISLKDVPLEWSPERLEFDGTRRQSYRFSIKDPQAAMSRLQTFLVKATGPRSNGREWKKPWRFNIYSDSEPPLAITFSADKDQLP